MSRHVRHQNKSHSQELRRQYDASVPCSIGAPQGVSCDSRRLRQLSAKVAELEEQLGEVQIGSNHSDMDTLVQRISALESIEGKRSRKKIPQVLAVDDVGEELDDPIAIAMVLLPAAYDGRIDLTLVMSGGDMTSDERLQKLNNYLISVRKQPLKFGKNYSNGILVRVLADDQSALQAELLYRTIDIFINNGPTSAGVMKVINGSLHKDSVSYLVGAEGTGAAKSGVNQQSTDEKSRDAWNKTFCKNHPHITGVVEYRHKFVLLPPSISRQIRFPNKTSIFPEGSLVRDIARRTLGMFVASRPGPFLGPHFPYHIPSLLFSTLKRLNEANHYCCTEWLKEMKKKEEELTNSDNAESKITEYLSKCQTQLDKNGNRVMSDEQIDTLRPLVSLPLRMTYHYASQIGVYEPYADGKNGFSPASKNVNLGTGLVNPGGAFINDTFFCDFCDRLMLEFKTTTPMYDVTNSALALGRITGVLVAGDIDSYKRMSLEYLE
jgi:hypothetical protein